MKFSEVLNETQSGVLDKLVDRFTGLAESEYQKGRMKGTEYAQLLLGVYDLSVSQSIQYVLQKDINTAQAEVLKQQRLNLITDNELTSTNINNVKVEIDTLKDNLANADIARALTRAETNKTIRSIDLLDETIESEIIKHRVLLADANLKEKGITKIVAEGTIAEEAIIHSKLKTTLLNTDVGIAENKLKGTILDLDKLTNELTIQKDTIVKSELSIDKAKLDISQTVSTIAVTDANKDKIETDINQTKMTTKVVEQQITTEHKKHTAMDKDIEVKDTGIKTEKAKGDLTRATTDKMVVEKAFLHKRIAGYSIEVAVMQKNIDKITADIKYSAKQLVIADSEIEIKKEEVKLMAYKAKKTDAEVRLLDGKAETEKLQPSLVQAQLGVYKAQARGFSYDAYIKAKKLSNDMVAIDASQGKVSAGTLDFNGSRSFTDNYGVDINGLDSLLAIKEAAETAGEDLVYVNGKLVVRTPFTVKA